jgi:hypothetical protein
MISGSRPSRALSALVFATTAALACGDVGPTDPYTAIAGPFILHSVDGQTIPAQLASGPDGTITVTTGSLTLRPDRTFREIWTVTLTSPSGAAQHGALVESGTYKLDGQSIVFSLPAAPGRGELTIQGTIRADTLSYTINGRVVVYLD